MRDRFYGFNGVVGAIAGMAAPPEAGFLIAYEDRLGGLSGYHAIFGLSLGLFVAAALLSAKLRPDPPLPAESVREAHRGGPTGDPQSERPPEAAAAEGQGLAARPARGLDLAAAWRGLRDRRWRMILVGCGVYGLREGVFLFLIGLLLYVATGSELRLGEFALLQGALSFGSFYGVGRYVRPRNRLRVLQIGATAMAGAALLFLLPVDARMIVIYGSLIALALPLFLVPMQGFVFDGIGQQCPSGRHFMEHIIMRELFGNAGRVIGIGAFLVLARDGVSTHEISRLAVGLGFVQLGTWLMVKAGVTGEPPAPGKVDGLHGVSRSLRLRPGRLRLWVPGRGGRGGAPT
ncbi:MAG: hypothetical protein K6T30_09895, partial [Alicyclobacillus sp.]|nr:hypothetical protein [Alicyclobacillus sp.]